MKYGIHVDLRVEATAGDDLVAEVEAIVEHLIELEDTTALLDSTIALNLAAMSVEADLTVEASTAGEALDLGVSVLRSAIHATGGATPGWEDAPAGVAQIAFVIDDDEGVHVRRLHASAA